MNSYPKKAYDLNSYPKQTPVGAATATAGGATGSTAAAASGEGGEASGSASGAGGAGGDGVGGGGAAASTAASIDNFERRDRGQRRMLDIRFLRRADRVQYDLMRQVCVCVCGRVFCLFVLMLCFPRPFDDWWRCTPPSWVTMDQPPGNV